MSTLNAFNQFIRKKVEVNDLVLFAHSRTRGGRYKFDRQKRAFIVESAFLKLFIAWEEFLESIFHAYLIGEPTITGAVVNRYLIPVDEDHAKSVLIGTQKYVDWSNPTIVVRLSKLYLGEPNIIQSGLNAINSDLMDLKTIRNAAAHLSSTTNAKLIALRNRLLGPTRAGVTSVYLLIMSTDPNDHSKTLFDKYMDLLVASATVLTR